MSPSLLRRLYADIIRGHSTLEWNGRTVYVKHLTVFDHAEVDSFYEDVLEKTKKRGVKTVEDKLAWLAAKKIWTADDEKKLTEHQSYLDNLKTSKAKAGLSWMIEQLDKQIAEAQAEVNRLSNVKNHAVGKTAESVADQKTQYEYVRVAFYTDAALTTPLFSREDMRELGDDDSYSILLLYVALVNQFNPGNLKRIALSPFFTNSFYLCGDSIFNFFGRPMVTLSVYQTNLLSYGLYYKNILTHHTPPKEIMDDPDKLEDFVNHSRGMKELENKAAAKGDRVAFIGGKPSDFKAAGMVDGTKQMQEYAKEGFTNAKDAAKKMGWQWSSP